VTTVRDTILRDLSDEIQSVIKVEETDRLVIDLREYVVTDRLAEQFRDVLGEVVSSARPATGNVPKVGVWVSGFFGSGKSHFAKLVGHLIADSATPAGTARELFERRLKPGNPKHDQVAALLQEARNYGLRALVVPFDIAAFRGSATETPERIVLKAFYHALGLSQLVAFAEREMQLQEAGKHDEFLSMYEARNGHPWAADQDLAMRSPKFAACLAQLLPDDYATVELAHQSLALALEQFETITPQDVARRLAEWLRLERTRGRDHGKIFFVADEVGAWAGRNLDRIEGVRALVQQFEVEGKGQLWLLATSQEKLTDVIQNAGVLDENATRQFLQRLEARFGTNVHLEPSGVGTVIEDRVLRKRPAARPALEQLYRDRQAWVADVAAKPGLEIMGEYPAPSTERFAEDYPFLPYQLTLAADIFGAMRGVKVSSGARSMLKVAFDSTKVLADADVGAVVSWDRIFDAANEDNEFADENYLGTPGLQSMERADQDLAGKVPIARPSRVLKVLWLMQQTNRVPCTESNLARLLVEGVQDDVLDLEKRLRATLEQLEVHSYVRRDVGSGQWRFLTPDEVTVEKIVTRIAGEVAAKDVRDEAAKLYAERLKALGSVVVGKSGTTFDYGVQLNATPLKSDAAPVQLKVYFDSTPTARKVAEDYAAYVEDSAVYWTVPVPERLEDRLRRVLAIGRLRADAKFNEIRTAKTDVEGDKLVEEGNQIRRQATEDLHRALGQGTLYWGGGTTALNEAVSKDANVPARASIEAAAKDRIALRYPRFAEGDRGFDERNIERLLDTPASKRSGLDPDLGLFDADGHVHADNVLAAALVTYVNGTAKTAGADLRLHFGAPPFGWPVHLPRYVATALFVDGRVALVDKTGIRHDNPRSPAARIVVGSRDFASSRVVIEENPLTPDEAAAIRELLKDLGEATNDNSELTLHDAARTLLQKLEKRLGVTERAKAVNLPLPPIYDELRASIDDVAAGGSRSTSLRALLAHKNVLYAGDAALGGLESFVQNRGLDQYQRAERMVELARQTGLEDDPEVGEAVADARVQIEDLKTQRRVLDEWLGAYESARTAILNAYRSRYAPVYADARARVDAGRAAILDDPDFARLGQKSLHVRVRFMGAGCSLQEIPNVPLTSEADLIAATGSFSLPLLRARIEEVDRSVAKAHAFIAELLAEKPKDTQATWSTTALTGKVFNSEASVDNAFDAEKDRIKALIRQGKTVRAI
jgi:hypothetical protein